MDLIALGMIIAGMWGAFYLGSRKEKDKVFDIDRNLEPEQMDMPPEVSDEEYEKALREYDETG